MIGWITQRPNNVIAKNLMNWVLPPVLLSLNVNFLLAKKLKIRAIEVEMKLLVRTGKPSDFNPKRMAKSMTVLVPPTSAKRILSACFFIGFSKVILLNKIQWSTFSFVKNAANIFANNT